MKKFIDTVKQSRTTKDYKNINGLIYDHLRFLYVDDVEIGYLCSPYIKYDLELYKHKGHKVVRVLPQYHKDAFSVAIIKDEYFDKYIELVDI